MAFLGMLASVGMMAHADSSRSVPLAGTAITNRATVQYFDEATGYPVTIQTNEVKVLVQPQEALKLTADRNVEFGPGATAYLAHRLTNTGNTPSQYNLNVSNLTGDDYDLSSLRLVKDLNGNGVADSGEPEILPTDLQSLAPGESLNLVIAGTIPVGTALGAMAQVGIDATTVSQSLSATNTDTVKVNGGVAMRLFKAVSSATAKQDDVLTYTMNALNIGIGAPQPISVLVDGAPQNLVVIRDVIPANTAFNSFVESTPTSPLSIRLYHKIGAGLDVYTTTQPSNPADIDAVALGVANWTPDSLQARLGFTVKVLSSTTPLITNVANIRFKDIADSNTIVDTPSNPVNTTIVRDAPTIQYYTDSTFSTLATATSLGDPLYLEINAASCNKDPERVDLTTITIVSQLTGDSETIQVLETGPNTGIFRPVTPVPTADAAQTPVVNGNGIMETTPRDRLRATIVDCAGQTAFTDIIVNPYGVVFDARTNAPISGATVTLTDLGGTPVAPPVVTGADGVFGFPGLAPGDYKIRVTTLPPGFTYPSIVPPALLPLNRTVNANGSYEKAFTVPVNGAISFDIPIDSGAPAGLFLEKGASNSVVELGDYLQYKLHLKNKTGVALYNVVIEDDLPQGFSLVPGTVRRKDVGNSNTITMPDPIGSPGSHLTFELGTLLVNADVTLTYRVRVGAGAGTGDAINRAISHGDTPYGVVNSNEAAVAVQVQSGVLNTRGIIIGKVYVDSNRNNIQDKGEVGIPGVRLWLESGDFVVTDSEGKYSIYGLSPRTHVVKLDTTTMPPGSRLSHLDYNHAGSGSSSFADLRMGGLVKVNFAIHDASPEVLSDIDARRKTAASNGTSLDSAYNTQLRQETQTNLNSDRRSQPASGIVNNTATGSGKMTIDSVPTAGIASSSMASGTLFNDNNTNALGSLGSSTLGGGSLGTGASGSGSDIFTSPGDGGLTFSNSTLSGALGASQLPSVDGVRLSTGGVQAGEQLHGDATKIAPAKPIGSGNSNLPSAPVRILPSVPLESAIGQADNSLAFLNLQDGNVLPIDQTNIQIKGATGAKIVLSVNGKEVPENRIGKRTTIEQRQLEAREYIGVALQAGSNIIELTQFDVAGNPRGDVKINMIAPGKLGQLQIYTDNKTLYADGRTAVRVHVRLTDDKGVPVTVRTPLTLQVNVGEWEVVDLNPLEPGVQVFLEGGQGSFALRSPIQPGDSLVKITSGVLGASVRLSFVPDLRPLVGVGILEGRLGAFRVKGAKQESSLLFEEQLRSLSGSDKGNLEGRAAMFFKGRVSGKYLLTLRYDSQKDEEDQRLFRDIQPDEYYPVYGDSSLRGYDAQSTSRLYVRVDKNKSYVLYGDFTTPGQNLASALGQYNRSLTGGKLHTESKNFELNAFASHDSSKQVVDEVPANGTSGPYHIQGGGDVVRQSEQVELVVRDRNQPSVILRVEPQTRFSDYQIDGLTDGILFRSPVPSRDADLNPVFVRVTYEVDNGGANFFVGGLSAQLRVGNKLILGGSYNESRDPLDPFKLRSVNAMLKVSPSTLLIAEMAQSDLQSKGSDHAERIELLHESTKLQARILLARSGENFSNPSSLLSAGQEQASLRASYALGKGRRVLAEAIYSHDLTADSKRQGVALSLEQVIARGVRLQLGVRHIKDTGSDLIGEDVNFTSIRARVTGQLPHTPLTLFTEYERAISGEGQALTIGGEYQIGDRSRLYFRHELLNSLAGVNALDNGTQDNATVVGVDTAYMKNGRVFSEYRINDGIDGRSAEAAIGLRNLWTLSRAIRVGTSFERVKNLSGGSSLDSNYTGAGVGTAGAVAVEYLPKDNFKATARVEVRRGDTENSYLGTAGVAYKANKDWTFLARGILTKRETPGSSNINGDGFDYDNGLQMRFQLGVAWRQTERDRWNGLAKYEYRTDTNDGGTDSSFRQRAHIISLDLNNQLNAKTDIGLHYAWKLSLADGDGISSSGSSQLLSGRITHDFTHKLQLSLLGGLFKDGRAGNGMQSGLAAELGFRIKRDMTIGFGYSLLDVNDDDLGLDFNKRGPYIRLRWKFDENLFSRGENTETALANAGRGVQISPALPAAGKSDEVSGDALKPVPFATVDEDKKNDKPTDGVLTDEEVQELGLDQKVVNGD